MPHTYNLRSMSKNKSNSRFDVVQQKVQMLMQLEEAPSDPMIKKEWEIAQKAKNISLHDAVLYIKNCLKRKEQLDIELSGKGLSLKTRLLIYENSVKATFGNESLPYHYRIWSSNINFLKSAIEKLEEFENCNYYNNVDWWIQVRPFYKTN